jgi:putative addiction module component (TIGR02574 family)
MATPSVSDLLKLDVEERLELIRILWNSIVDSGRELPLTDTERAELDRRLAEHAADPDAGIPRIRGEH